MASISTSHGTSGRKALSIDLPLVPFLDLLLCCLMFLLQTAMWNELAALRATQRAPGLGMDVPAPPEARLVLTLTARELVLTSDAGDRQLVAAGDRQALRSVLDARRRLYDGAEPFLVVTAEDGVHYEALTAAMDDARAVGFRQLEISSSAF